jgi:hypothetical protein
MILAILAEMSYIPTTWNNTSHLPRRFLFLPVALVLAACPTFYIAIVENQAGGGGSLALILGIAQFFLSLSSRPCCLESCPQVGCLATGLRVSLTSISHLKFSRPVIQSAPWPARISRIVTKSCLAILSVATYHLHPYDHVYHGPRPILPGRAPVVCHLEYCLLHLQSYDSFRQSLECGAQNLCECEAAADPKTTLSMYCSSVNGIATFMY